MAVRDVFVDGNKVVEQGKVLTLDCYGAVGRIEEAQQRMIERIPSEDYAGRSVDEIAPLSIPMG